MESLKYVYYEDQHAFQALEYDFQQYSNYQILQQYGKGINETEALHRLQIYGNCEIDIEEPNYLKKFFLLLLRPHYFLAYFSFVAKAAQGVWLGGLILVVITILAGITELLYLAKGLKRIREQAANRKKVKIFRKNNLQSYQEFCSSQLVPGDIFALESHMKLPCDCVLISGELLLNEASLTGESIPIPKIPLEKSDEKFDLKNNRKHVLYESTYVMRTKCLEEQYVLALVLRTGYSSFKGQIFRRVLYPPEIKFKFYYTVAKFVTILILVFLVLSIFVVFQMKNKGFDTLAIFVQFINNLTQVLPPAIPMMITFNAVSAVKKLQKNNILCQRTEAIIISSQVDIMCFDKTGTLTTTNMDVLGYCKNDKNNNLEDIVIKPEVTQEFQQNDFIFQAFACCHGVYIIDGQKQGDLLDVSMVDFSGWQMEDESENPSVKFTMSLGINQLQVLKVFEFEPELQRMACVVQNTQTQKYYYFTKGSPEMIQQIIGLQNMPQNQSNTIDLYVNKGFRLISLGYKQISEEEVQNNKMQDFETDLIYLGIIVFENVLKDKTTETINTLMQAEIECRVISGDNPLTTIQMARECGILDQNKQVYLFNSSNGQDLIMDTVECSDIRSSYNSQIKERKKQYQIKNNFMNVEEQQRMIRDAIKDLKQGIQFNQIEVALTGQALSYFQEQNTQCDETKTIINISINSNNDVEKANHSGDKSLNELNQDLFHIIVKNSKIFSRMKPMQKATIISNLQSDQIKVGMIGDGANDCQAIKQADTYLITSSLPAVGFISLFRPSEKLTSNRVQSNFLSLEVIFQVYGQIMIMTGCLYSLYYFGRSFDEYIPLSLNTKYKGYHHYGDAITTQFIGYTIYNIFIYLSTLQGNPFKEKIYKVKSFCHYLGIFLFYGLLMILFPKTAFSSFDLNKSGSNLQKNNNFRYGIAAISLGFGIFSIIYRKVIIDYFLVQKKSSIKQKNDENLKFK